MSEPSTFLFSGYARLPQDVSHQAMYKRVGIVLEVDERGTVVACTTSVRMDVARTFFAELLVGRNVVSERREIEALIRYRYRGHSQGALISALGKVYEAVDQSPIVIGEAAARAAGEAAARAATARAAGTGHGASGREPGPAVS